MKYLWAIFKLCAFAIIILNYAVAAFMTIIFLRFNFSKARHFLVYIISMTCRLGIRIFDIKLTIKGNAHFNRDNTMIVSNHLSYLDIFSISCIWPTSFVTSVEMKETPFLGELCLLGGCHFVERRSRSTLDREVNDIADSLKEGVLLTIFPEAKSTNGEKVLPFRGALFQSAVISKAHVQPICINYKSIDGVPVTTQNRDSLFWYGDTPFFAHFLKLIQLKDIEIEIDILESLEAKNFSTRSELADKCYELISKTYHPIN